MSTDTCKCRFFISFDKSVDEDFWISFSFLHTVVESNLTISIVRVISTDGLLAVHSGGEFIFSLFEKILYQDEIDKRRIIYKQDSSRVFTAAFTPEGIAPWDIEHLVSKGKFKIS